MDLRIEAPPSDDGLYGLVDLGPVAPPAKSAPAEPTPAAPARAPATVAAKPEAPEKPKAEGGGFFGKLLGKGKEKPAAKPEPEPAAESPAAPSLPPAAAGAAPKAPEKPKPAGGPKLRVSKKPKRSWKYDAPAWVVSALVHAGLFVGLGVVAISAQEGKKPPTIDSAPFDPKIAGAQADEAMHVYTDPGAIRSETLGGEANADAPASTPGGAAGLGTGTGPPSATPRLSGSGSGVGEGSLPQVKVVANLSALSMLPVASPSKDFSMRGGGGGGSGGIAGDVTMGTKDVGEALDQLAREILRHLAAHKLTVIWLFDESGSMKDDQRAVKEKFGRVTSELNVNLGDDKKTAGALNHVIYGFGNGLDPAIAKPTADVSLIGKAIDRLPVDSTGTERTCEAVARIVNEYAKQMKDGRRMILVLVTDESGDDGQNVEEARQALVSHGVPLYVIGRQSLFGYETAHIDYEDPVTHEHYYPAIRRGPESAEREILQIDGLHERQDEQPSGFAPYELARLAKDSGGIYFLLPSEENMRVKHREKNYSIATLKEYVPSYENRADYLARREKSELGRRLHECVLETSKDYVPRRHYPVNPEECFKAMQEEGPICQQRFKKYQLMEARLRAIKNLRDREPDKRWQAHYDLVLAQVVTYKLKMYEYMACLDEMMTLIKKGQLKPSKMPIPDKLNVTWVINHSGNRKAPKAETEKMYAEAKTLLDQVIKNHPNTPWADLAQDEINRGFSCDRGEESHGPGYAERAKLVPKY